MFARLITEQLTHLFSTLYLAAAKIRGSLMQDRRTHILFYSLMAMPVFLFFSRGLLSAALILFTALSFAHRDIPAQWRRFLQTPLLWGMSLLLLVPLFSGLWSADKTQWWNNVQVKLPLLFLPLAFAGPLEFTRNQWRLLAGIFILLVTAGAAWSFFQYGSDPDTVNEGYLRAKSLITPLSDDHVRFSWMVSIAVLLSGWMGWMYRKENRVLPALCFLIAALLILYLHLLAARTGLISLYGMLLFFSIWLILKMKKTYGFLLILFLAALPVIAWLTLPTFQNRVRYFRYDLGYFKNADYLPGANDAVRVISLKAGWNLLRENPVAGVGFGDLLTETKKWYETKYPGMLERDKIFPSSEWLLYGAGAGIPGICLFALSMYLPFFTRTRQRLCWYLVNGTAALSLLADIGLEVQFGVFLYSFIVLWCWKWWTHEKG